MIKRYNAQNVFDMKESGSGAFVLYSDMSELLLSILDKAVEAGADKEKLQELLDEAKD